MKRRSFVAALGAASLAPFSAIAQPRRMARVAYFGQRAVPWLVDPLRERLGERGWVVGRNLVYEVVSTEGDYKRADALAQKLVEQRTDVIVVAGTHMALAAQRVTKTTPIVMYLSGFPVEGGLVQSFARPGGNITGLATYSGEAFFSKHVSLMKELIPSLKEFAVLWDYLPPLFLEKEVEFGLGELRRAASELKVSARIWTVADEDALTRAFADIAKMRIQVLFATNGSVQGIPARGLTRLIDFTRNRKIALICDIAGTVFVAGGLLSYSASWQEAADRCASFVDRILRGANPAELPIERPSRFELVLNLKTAKAIGITIPPPMLIRADRVIE
jgi:putative ABC transport system substrate-binding protein